MHRAHSGGLLGLVNAVAKIIALLIANAIKSNLTSSFAFIKSHQENCTTNSLKSLKLIVRFCP